MILRSSLPRGILNLPITKGILEKTHHREDGHILTELLSHFRGTYINPLTSVLDKEGWEDGGTNNNERLNKKLCLS